MNSERRGAWLGHTIAADVPDVTMATWPRSGRCRPIAVGHGCVVQGYWAGVQPSGKVNVDGVGVPVRPATVDHHPSSQAASSVRREACGLVFLGCRSWRIVAPSPPTRPQARMLRPRRGDAGTGRRSCLAAIRQGMHHRRPGGPRQSVLGCPHDRCRRARRAFVREQLLDGDHQLSNLRDWTEFERRRNILE
jgi:hypothetical protein